MVRSSFLLILEKFVVFSPMKSADINSSSDWFVGNKEERYDGGGAQVACVDKMGFTTYRTCLYFSSNV